MRVFARRPEERFSMRARDTDFLDCETETSKCFNRERETFGLLNLVES